MLSTTSSAEEYDGTGSVYVTMLGTTHSFEGISEERYPDLHWEDVPENGSSSHSQTFPLTGDDGTFSVEITGSLDTGSNGVFSGRLQVNPVQIAGTTVVIKKPAPNAPRLHDTSFPVIVKWFSPAAIVPGVTVRVRIEVKVAGSASYVTKALVPQPLGLSGTATTSISISTIGVADMRATLEIVAPVSGFVFSAGTATSSVIVN